MDAQKMQDAVMQGVARYHQWKTGYLKTMQEAAMKGQLKQAWAQMPPAMKEMLKQQDPESYEQVRALIEGE